MNSLPSSFKPLEQESPKLPSSFKASKEENPLSAGFFPLVKQPAKDTQENATRAISQIPQGLAELTPYGLATGAFQLLGTGEALSELEDLEERLPDLKKKFPQLKFPEKIDREKYLEATQAATGIIPSVANIAKFVEDQTGIPLSPKTPLDKLLRFASQAASGKPGSPQQMIFNGLKGEAAKEVLVHAGVPEPVAEGLALSYAYHEKTPEIKSSQEKAPVIEKQKPTPGSPPDEVITHPSGIEKSKASEAKNPQRGIISSERQKKSIEKLNSEAAELTQKSIEKHVPQVKNVQEGHDFDFNKRFGDLETPMVKANPEIDISPVSEFLGKESKKYRGIPNDLLHGDARKVLKEIGVYRNRPQTSGKNLYKLYRINNRKLKNIHEQRLLKGHQDEYADFLIGLNRSIADSFEHTLPEGGKWITEFKNLNKEYGQVQKANKSLHQLEDVLNGEASPATLRRLSKDPKAQKKLEISMGKEGASEVIQIAKDLKQATEDIKKITVKELNVWDAAFPLSAIIPGLHIPGSIAAAKKGVEFGQRAYGYYLTTPAKRKAYDKALDAISHKDLNAYKSATESLK